MTRWSFGDTNVFLHFPKFDRNRGSPWMHFCLYMSHRILHVLLFANQLSAILPPPAEDQGTHHKMVSLQPMPSFLSVGDGDNMYTAYNICNMIEFLIDNFFVQFGRCLFPQVILYPGFQRPLEKQKMGPLVPRGIQLFYESNQELVSSVIPVFYNTMFWLYFK